jgi:hypothetical protein
MNTELIVPPPRCASPRAVRCNEFSLDEVGKIAISSEKDDPAWPASSAGTVPSTALQNGSAS